MAEKKKYGSQKSKRSKSAPAALLNLDYNNLMENAVGSNGLSADDLEVIKQALIPAVKSVQDQYKKGLLPYMDLPFKTDEIKQCRLLGDSVRKDFDNIVVLGIGGSALGTSAVMSALMPQNRFNRESKKGSPRLLVADNIDPESFSMLLDSLDIRKTLFNVISKSGATAETMSQFMIVYEKLRHDFGKTALKKHLVVTTDPSGGVLRKIVEDHDLTSLEVPPGVGGRFSVLTPVGLFPLAAAGVNIDDLLHGAAVFQSSPLGSPMRNMASVFAGLNWFLTTKKKRGSLVMMPYADSLGPVADWFGQLWNESLGKAKYLTGRNAATGQTAIKAVGATDQHSQLQLYMEGPQDKTVCFLRTDSFRHNLAIPEIFKEHSELAYLGGHSLGELLNYEQRGTARALAASGRPNMLLSMPQVTAASLGYLIQMLETATVISGALYKINPLDQPGVELGKNYTYGLMGRSGYKEFKTMYDKGLGSYKKYML